MNNYTKEELQKLIYDDKISYRELGRINNVSDSYIKKYAKKLGIELPTRAKFPDRSIPFNKGKKKIKNEQNQTYSFLENSNKLCKVCNNVIQRGFFCSFECMGENKKQETTIKYKKAIETNTNIAPLTCISTYKRYILEEQQNCCEICKIPNIWENKELILILDHIDGNANNNKRENLRCVCPNCDSQLSTFKSRNKNSARKERYLKNYKN